jgi:hypothetical protein
VSICSIQGEKALSLFSRSGFDSTKQTEWMREVYIDLEINFLTSVRLMVGVLGLMIALWAFCRRTAQI